MCLTMSVAFTISFSFVLLALLLVFAKRREIYSARMKSVPPPPGETAGQNETSVVIRFD